MVSYSTDLSPDATLVLTPPYTALRALLVGESPGLGSLLIVDTGERLNSITELLQLQHSFPWCPIVALDESRRLDTAILSLTVAWPNSVIVVPAPLSAVFTSSEIAIAAVSRRAAPGPLAVAAYIGRRTRRPDIIETLAECLSQGADRHRHRTTLRRRLRTFPPLLPRDWAAVGDVISTLQPRRADHQSPERVALGCGIDPRTLRRRTRQYAAVSASDTLSNIGWEWFAESVLRLSCYVSAEQPSRGDGTQLSRDNRERTLVAARH